MIRLIDADALHEQFYDLTKFKKDKHTGDWVSQRSVKISDALRMINDAPTVEADIVRCKDCDNRHTDDCPMYHEEWYEIDEGDGYFDGGFTVHDYSNDDGFCSWAKMKGGDE